MHFQYLVEDQSGAALIRILMQKIVELYPNATYDCKGFRGIGGFTRKNTIKETKTGKLLNDLATYLRGFDRSLQSFPSVIIVVLDSDDHDVQQFRSELEAVAMQNMIKIDHVFCLAVEEIEAWLDVYKRQPEPRARPNSAARPAHYTSGREKQQLGKLGGAAGDR